MTPITRKEMFLAKLSGESVTTPDPVTREELFLAKLCGDSVETPEPITRLEFFLDSLAGNEHPWLTPMTRLEYFIAAAGGADVPELTPITREEMYWSGIEISGVDWTTVTGAAPLALADALAKPIKKLIQFGKVATVDNETYCNNGKLVAVDDELPVVGTPEVLTVGEQTATVENLLAVDGIKDEQNIISGTVTRRCEAVISDGTTPSGRYIGEVGEGNIIVKVRETGYEGDVATFEADRAEPLNGMTVNVSPIQDLHGYDSPWPAGGGKNKLNSGFCLNRTSRGLRTVVNADGSITLTGTAETATRYWNSADNLGLTLAAGTYTLSPSNLRLEKSGGSVYGTFTLSEETTFSNVYWGGFTSGEVVNTIVYPQLEIGSTATAYAPYENICPISGRTSATVTRTGRNLFPDAGDITVVATKAFYYNSPIIFKGQTVTLSFSDITYSGGFTSSVVFFLRANNAGITSLNFNTSTKSKTWTATEDVYGINFYATSSGATNRGVTTVYHDAQLELGSTATAYEPYQGNTYTIQIGQTAYGGTLDVTGGKMVADRAIVDLGTLNWGYGSDSAEFYTNGIAGTSINWHSWADTPPLLCSRYKPISNALMSSTDFCVGYAYNSTQLRIKDSHYTVAADFKAAMSGVQLCYELATPLEITLTPTQIDTLLGTNNVWADAGDVKAYVADVELIEQVTAQPMRTAEGSNTVVVTSAVDPVQLEVIYAKAGA